MRRSEHIQRLVALLLLGCFVFGNTPKSLLHDVFAGHEDYVVICHHSTTCIHQESVDCDIDDLVVNASYLSSVSAPSTHVDARFKQPVQAIYLSVYAPSWFSFRDFVGPPSNA